MPDNLIDLGRLQVIVELSLPRERLVVRLAHALGDEAGRLAVSHRRQLLLGERGHLDSHVDAIEQRARDAVLVTRDQIWRASALDCPVAEVTARARIHRGDQLKLGRILDLPRRARHGDAAGFERLPQRFEHAPLEFRQLVEKQHAMVRQRNLAGHRWIAAAHQRDCARSVMRRAVNARGPALRCKLTRQR